MRAWPFCAVIGVPLLGLAIGLPVAASRYEEKIRRETYVSLVPIGGLTDAEAREVLARHWEMRADLPFEFVSDYLPEGPMAVTPRQAGVVLDLDAVLAELPRETFWQRVNPVTPTRRDVRPVYAVVDADLDFLVEVLAARLPQPQSARIDWREGRIVAQPEVPGLELDREGIAARLIDRLNGGTDDALPIRESARRVTSEHLAQMREVVAEFSTNFPRYQTSRNRNIELASDLLTGTILLPGEEFSFNDVVGPRTVGRGFREAGIYVNGRHDTGIGGGICQVSTTLYNAALLSDLQIVRRANHSMPVNYVPVGRDAAVSYGTLDLVFRNNREYPIAVTMEYQAGKVTARILGVRDPELSVTIESANHRSWSRGEKVVEDPTLAPGTSRIVEKGSAGHSIQTFRVVRRNGQVVRRDTLPVSHYPGGVRIVARNSESPAPLVPEHPAPVESDLIGF